MPSLTWDEARGRAELLEVHAYEIDLDLTGAGTGEPFDTVSTVHFSCVRPGASTFVELKAATPHEVRLNGVALDPAALVDNRLPLSDLAADNVLVVRASAPYSHTGEGLHRFVDPSDGAVYLYAQACSDDAQRIFACFDQPDLKARMALRVRAPEGWLVAANGEATEVAPGEWVFAPTLPLSPYLMTLIAGPYHVRRDSHDGIPLALYCRRALAGHLDKDVDEIFEVTRACLDRYHELFGVRYPFGPYGQAFVPEFNAGAMENPGLVTFRDEFVFRSAVSEPERQLRAVVIAHEMAHMWFGDLVTMRWWDDLWLNESFAEYMGYRVVAEATRFTGAWTDFAVGRKSWGYATDQRPSTHPVAPESVPDVGVALLNFDGISYAKGAAVLRQLAAWISDEAFIAGLRRYFERHAYGNATLADLLAALSETSGRDLAGWAEVWLRRAQVNTLRPRVTTGPDGVFTTVEVEQTAPAGYPVLRPHRVGIGVYSGGSVVRRVDVDLAPAVDGGLTPVPELAGTAAGDLLLLNDGDLTYAKVRFTPDDAERLPRVLPTLDDPLARALVWGAVTEAVRDGEIPARDFVDLCAAALPGEPTLTVFRDIVRFAHATVVDRFLPPSERDAAGVRLAQVCRAVLVAADPGQGRQLVAARAFVAFAGPREVPWLRAWLSGADVPPGLALDDEMRWLVLHRLSVLGLADAAQIEAEYHRDHTPQGAEHAARCRAAMPDAGAKAAAWRVITADSVASNRIVAATAEGFWQPAQDGATSAYVERYFTDMPAVARWRTPQVLIAAASAAYPRFAVEPRTVAAAEELLARPDVPPTLRRIVVDLTDELHRALRARAGAAGRSDVGHAAAS
jgi:aminopeptidase N